MIINNITGEKSYIGATLYEYDHMWLDGMLEVYAVVWDIENHTTKHFKVGYYGADGRNLSTQTAKYEAISDEVRKDIIETIRKSAHIAFSETVVNYKNTVHKGSTCEVIRGRKVKKGTILKVFWTGERPTYKSKMYSYINEFENIAGCYDRQGNKVWIKTEYLKVIDTLKSPSAKERKKFIKSYIKDRMSDYHIK